MFLLLSECKTVILPTLEAVGSLHKGVDVGPCTLGSRIHPGSYSQVFTGVDDDVDTDVVLKTARAINQAQLDASIEQITREGEILSMLTHPLIPRLYRIAYFEGIPVLEMERKHGVPLNDYANAHGGCLPWWEAVRLAYDLADELAYIHDKGILHRDVKPANVLFVGGRAALLDFGIGRRPGEKRLEGHLLTLTKPYAAPEQFQGLSSELSDVFSLGATLFALIEGRSPYVDPDAGTELHPLTTDCPPQLKLLIQQMLSINPQLRPPAHRVKRLLEALQAAA